MSYPDIAHVAAFLALSTFGDRVATLERRNKSAENLKNCADRNPAPV